ncbi:MAG TPA: hypothetical protein H9783_04465 [Candidatus Limosilactobacillus faecipullorum]|nr:hypothetical protein [Candidatus Limosilactobacillus faecipullorum]
MLVVLYQRAKNNAIKLEYVGPANVIEESSLIRSVTDMIINAGITVSQKKVWKAVDTVNLSDAYDYMVELAISNGSGSRWQAVY